jgi:hypothetical protein
LLPGGALAPNAPRTHLESADIASIHVPQRLLIPIALLLLAAVAIGWWWSGARSQAPGKPKVDVATVDVAADLPVATGATRLETTIGTSVEPGAANRRAPSAAASRDTPSDRAPGTGTITGVVRARVDSNDTVTSGFVRIEAVPAVPGTRRDDAEQARLFIAEPVVLIDRAGRFAFPRIPFGEWLVSAQPEGFEPRDRRIVLSPESPTAELEFITRPNRPTNFSIALLDESGKPLLDRSSATRPPDPLSMRLMNAGALRPLILDTCPPVGKELRKAERRRLNGFEPALSQRADPWTTVTLPGHRDGCACALLGDIVVAAVPFVAGQTLVELRILDRDLVVSQRACEVLVIDAETSRPLPNATVRFNSARGPQIVGQSDAEGLARAESVLVGKLEIVVELAGYEIERSQHELAGDSRSPLTAVWMKRPHAIQGVVRLPSQTNAQVLVAAIPTEEWSNVRPAIAYADRADGQFTLRGLVPARYLVGVLTTDTTPDTNRVRRNEVEGWTWVPLIDSDVEGLTLEVSAAMVPKLRDWLTNDEAGFLQDVVRDKADGR